MCPVLLSLSPLTNEITLMVVRTLQTVLLEECYLWSFFLISCGGKVHRGCHFLHMNGQTPQLLLPLIFLINVHTCLQSSVHLPLIPFNQYSSYTCLLQVTAWIMCFAYLFLVRFSRASQTQRIHRMTTLSADEITHAEVYWIRFMQRDQFAVEFTHLERMRSLPKSRRLLCLHPFIDPHGTLCVGGREQNTNMSYSHRHPIILHGRHPIVKLIIRSEHIHLLNVGPTLV